MSFSQLLSILKARRYVALGIFLFTVLVTVVVSLILPKQYTAEATVVVDVKSPDPIAGMVLPGMMSPAYMGTQIEVIQSERVARRVINELRLAQNESIRQQWRDETNGEGSFEAWLTDVLQRRLSVKPARESNVITISYSAVDPRFAAALANAFMQAYIATNLELRVEPARQFGTMFEAQNKQVREQLEAAQSRLSAYQKEKGIIATDERLDVETARLNELSSQLVAMQSATAESISRQAAFDNSSQEVLNNSVVAALKADLARQEARLKESQARFGEAHPVIVELKASIAELRQRIDAESGRVARSVGINKSVALSREGQLRAALDQQRQRVLQLKAQRDEAAVLLRDVENAQRAYDTLQARLYQTNLEAQTTQTNISVLKDASPPAKHASPKLLLNTALSVFMGLLLGVGCALLLELRDRRLRTDEDVSQELGAALLGVMPRSDGTTEKSAFRLPRIGNKTTPQLAAPKP
ncbi:chain length determinant protein EpsF [Aquabacterium fontiphilum]|uniref:chain length determinant protein EpsF n=1 Tax=Aquabacterium fontiphilum TaxID=450365 RepID=UPI0013772D8A|nr:chain length determinant protein EpsF [Aquabacterium fontiphilum]NBD22226.1 chain length determinant protein EpsF [Aquabacterium fontiphilum]